MHDGGTGRFDTMTLAFAVAAPSQHDEIEGILRAAFTPYVREVGYELAADAYSWLGPSLEKGDIYVGLDGEKTAAVIATSRRGQEMVIDYFAVDPGRQGSGIGSRLLAELEALARADGIRALVLHTAEIREDLLRFYRRHGFVEMRRAPPAHGKDKHVRVHMRKAL